MKYLIINNIFYPDHKGGAEIVVQRIADYLIEKGDEVCILATTPKLNIHSIKSYIDTYKGAKLYRYNPPNIASYQSLQNLSLFLRLFWHIIDTFNVHAYFKIKKILQNEKPDIILSHNFMGLGLLSGRAIEVYIKKRKKQSDNKKNVLVWVHTLHDIQLSYPSGQLVYNKQNIYEKSFLQTLYKKSVQLVFGRPQIVISPSRFLLDFYKKQGFFKNSKTIVLRNPIKMLDNEVKITAHKKPVFLLYIGSLEKYKGINWLLENFQKYKSNEIKLIIAGKGSQEAYVQECAHNDSRIVFKGFIQNENLSEIFDQAHFLILPSLTQENSPTVIYESYLHKTPVIVADSGGAGELVIHNQTGFVFEAGNGEELERIFSKIIDMDSSEYDNSCSLSLKTVKLFSLNDYFSRLNEIL